MGYDDVPGLRVTLDGPVLRLALDHQERRNAVDDVMLDGMVRALQQGGLDERVRLIVLEGAGEHFCSGTDLVARNSGTERPRVSTITRRLPAKANLLLRLITETQTPILAVVQGWAAGLGFNLALAADFCVARSDAQFWHPFVARGFSPDTGATWLLPRLVGPVRARQLLILGRRLSGAEAAQWGLIHAAADPTDFPATVTGLIDDLASSATVAVGLTKWLMTSGAGLDLDRHLVNEGLALELTTRTADFREGLSAFREKRTPRFEGR